jgi:hypothetical protein
MIILFHFQAEVVAVDKSLTYVKLPITLALGHFSQLGVVVSNFSWMLWVYLR